MSLGLHKDCRKRLIEVVAAQLPKITVKHRMFLDRVSAVMLLLADGTLPKSGQLRRNLEEYLGEMPFTDFAIEHLSRMLSEHELYDSSSDSLPLVKIEGYEDPLAVASGLVDQFDSLPWQYMLSIELGNDFGDFLARTLKSFPISDSVCVITPTEELGKTFPLKTGVEGVDASLGIGRSLLNLFSEPQWNCSSSYLQIQAKGFIGRNRETKPLGDAISLLKAFCGVAIALRLLKHSYTSPTKRAKFFAHRFTEDCWRIDSIHELDSSFSDTFHALIPDDLDGHLTNEEERTWWMQERFKDISLLFGNQQKAQKILLASQWLFESYCGKNELLAFVQIVVVMEILLGEKAMSDILGLGELLRNRCAYLIGQSHKQREQVLSDFKSIYELRSNIVHRGKAKLSLTEKVLSTRLEWMCCRVIQEEVRLLREDFKEAPGSNVISSPRHT